MKPRQYEKFTGFFAILAGIIAFFYAFSFIVVSRTNAPLGAFLSSLFLTVQGFVLLKVYVGLYKRVRDAGEGFALEALLLVSFSAIGMAVHGGYDLANIVNADPNALILASLPNQIDPRGLLTFGAGGVGLMKFAYLMRKSTNFPAQLAALGFVSGALLLAIYLARLTVLDPTNPVLLYPVLANGFLLGPLFYLWLGSVLWNDTKR